ncbi:MAG: HD domain-containing protein [Desulfohalobiaceae bacterium]|nr:HD domain-containing protein [Desulfohalobiaceae bacterium]
MESESTTLNHVLNVIEHLNRFNDIQSLMDNLLKEMRKYSNADAGTIYLNRDGKLSFSYVHNDTLFTSHTDNKHLYTRQEIPINSNSLVGHAAATGQLLEIDDVYELSDESPYCFNASFDQETGYRTKSMLVVPLRTTQNKLSGVLQLINAKDEQGATVPFSEECKKYLPLFAYPAAEVIERCQMTRDFVLRMIRMIQLHDPYETGRHVYRVGYVAAEIYNKWALNHHLDADRIQREKDSLRLAAMLHDIGKVGIPNQILKKPGKLTEDEFATVKGHCVYGARLFADPNTDLDQMIYNVALGHHEKWNGQGYPGNVEDIFAEGPPQYGQGKQGEEIPIEGRITAIADVYDALCSKRCYKTPWPEEKVLAVLQEEAGKSFDPELIEVFMSIHEIILAIKEKFQEVPSDASYESGVC